MKLNGVNSVELDRLVYGSPHNGRAKVEWWPLVTAAQRAGLVRVALSGTRDIPLVSIAWTEAGREALTLLRGGAH